MEVTFIARSRVMGYKPGQIVKAELTPMLEALLRNGKHLDLVDPPSLDPVKSEVKKAKPEKDFHGGSTSPSDSEERGQASRENNGESTSKSV